MFDMKLSSLSYTGDRTSLIFYSVGSGISVTMVVSGSNTDMKIFMSKNNISCIGDVMHAKVTKNEQTKI